MPDVTAHRHPVIAVPCPVCRAATGTWCQRPSGHRASALHAARRAGGGSQLRRRLRPLGRDSAGVRHGTVEDRGSGCPRQSLGPRRELPFIPAVVNSRFEPD